MNIRFLVLLLVSLPLLSNSQSKRTMRKLQKQVDEAKRQEAAAKTIEENKITTLKFIDPGASLGTFQFVNAENKTITEQDIPNDKPVLLVLFNPMCDHCQKAAMTIKDNIDKFKDVTILFVCGMNLLPELKNFSTSSGVDGIPNFMVCAASEEWTNHVFASKGIPQIMAYNKNRILQQTTFEILNVENTLNALSK